MSRCKASENPRNEAYAYGTKHTVQGVWPKVIITGGRIKTLEQPYTLYLEPFSYVYAAVTRDEGNVADGCFPTASTVFVTLG